VRSGRAAPVGEREAAGLLYRHRDRRPLARGGRRHPARAPNRRRSPRAGPPRSGPTRVHPYLRHQARRRTTICAHRHERTGAWVDPIAGITTKTIAARLAAIQHRSPPLAPSTPRSTPGARPGPACCVTRATVRSWPYGLTTERGGRRRCREPRVCLDTAPAVRAAARESLPRAHRGRPVPRRAADHGVPRQRRPAATGRVALRRTVGVVRRGRGVARRRLHRRPGSGPARRAAARGADVAAGPGRPACFLRPPRGFPVRLPRPRARRDLARPMARATASPAVGEADRTKPVRAVSRWRSESFTPIACRESLGWITGDGPAETPRRRVQDALRGLPRRSVRWCARDIPYRPWQIRGSVRTRPLPSAEPHRRPGRRVAGAAVAPYDNESTERKGAAPAAPRGRRGVEAVRAHQGSRAVPG